MNWYWITAGILAIGGGVAHLYLGESRIISRLDAGALQPSPPMSGDTAKRYLRWFWHVGTVNILGAATVGLIIGLTNGLIPGERGIANRSRLYSWECFWRFALSRSPAQSISSAFLKGRLCSSQRSYSGWARVERLTRLTMRSSLQGARWSCQNRALRLHYDEQSLCRQPIAAQLGRYAS